jgi:hypothetical protein
MELHMNFQFKDFNTTTWQNMNKTKEERLL